MTTTEPTALPLTLGRQLAAARERAHLDQDQLGEIIGKDRSTVSRWERDKQAPPFPIVVQISRVTGWPLDLFARAIDLTDGPDTPDDLGSRDSGCYAAEIVAFPHAA